MKKKLAFVLALAMLAALAAGCGAEGGEASVQSVRMICGLGATGLVDRFAGMVSPQGETKIEKNESAQVAEIKVSVGEDVEEGQVLFTYDTAQLSLDLEKAKLELERDKNALENKKEEKKTWEELKAETAYEELAEVLLQIREIEADIQEMNFNLSLKAKDIQKLQDSLKNTSVTAPCDGRIQSINETGAYDDYGNPLPFMTIVQTDGYRIKGYVNESNIAALGEGTPVIVRSRVSEDIWQGTITLIEWDNPQQNNNNYYGESDTAMSSTYPFYVELESSQGLLLGQHVFIEPDYGQEAEAEANAIHLPAYYLADADSNPFVWAQSKSGKLEKRNVTLGEYDEMMDTYVVESGLTAEDYIAFPDDTLKPGMTCITYDESAFAPGADMSGEDFYMEGDMGGDMPVEEFAVDEGEMADNAMAVPEVAAEGPAPMMVG